MVESTRVAKLREAIASGQVVFITGTGVSVAACGNQEVYGHKVATWMGLLEHGAHALRDTNALASPPPASPSAQASLDLELEPPPPALGFGADAGAVAAEGRLHDVHAAGA